MGKANDYVANLKSKEEKNNALEALSKGGKKDDDFYDRLDYQSEKIRSGEDPKSFGYSNQFVKAGSMYTVQGGDSLSKLAGKAYGNQRGFYEIFRANSKLFSFNGAGGWDLTLRPGMELRIPDSFDRKQAISSAFIESSSYQGAGGERFQGDINEQIRTLEELFGEDTEETQAIIDSYLRDPFAIVANDGYEILGADGEVITLLGIKPDLETGDAVYWDQQENKWTSEATGLGGKINQKLFYDIAIHEELIGVDPDNVMELVFTTERSATSIPFYWEFDPSDWVDRTSTKIIEDMTAGLQADQPFDVAIPLHGDSYMNVNPELKFSSNNAPRYIVQSDGTLADEDLAQIAAQRQIDQITLQVSAGEIPALIRKSDQKLLTQLNPDEMQAAIDGINEGTNEWIPLTLESVEDRYQVTDASAPVDTVWEFMADVGTILLGVLPINYGDATNGAIADAYFRTTQLLGGTPDPDSNVYSERWGERAWGLLLAGGDVPMGIIGAKIDALEEAGVRDNAWFLIDSVAQATKVMTGFVGDLAYGVARGATWTWNKIIPGTNYDGVILPPRSVEDWKTVQAAEGLYNSTNRLIGKDRDFHSSHNAQITDNLNIAMDFLASTRNLVSGVAEGESVSGYQKYINASRGLEAAGQVSFGIKFITDMSIVNPDLIGMEPDPNVDPVAYINWAIAVSKDADQFYADVIPEMRTEAYEKFQSGDVDGALSDMMDVYELFDGSYAGRGAYDPTYSYTWDAVPKMELRAKRSMAMVELQAGRSLSPTEMRNIKENFTDPWIELGPQMLYDLTEVLGRFAGPVLGHAVDATKFHIDDVVKPAMKTLWEGVDNRTLAMTFATNPMYKVMGKGGQFVLAAGVLVKETGSSVARSFTRATGDLFVQLSQRAVDMPSFLGKVGNIADAATTYLRSSDALKMVSGMITDGTRLTADEIIANADMFKHFGLDVLDDAGKIISEVATDVPAFQSKLIERVAVEVGVKDVPAFMAKFAGSAELTGRSQRNSLWSLAGEIDSGIANLFQQMQGTLRVIDPTLGGKRFARHVRTMAETFHPSEWKAALASAEASLIARSAAGATKTGLAIDLSKAFGDKFRFQSLVKDLPGTNALYGDSALGMYFDKLGIINKGADGVWAVSKEMNGAQKLLFQTTLAVNTLGTLARQGFIMSALHLRPGWTVYNYIDSGYRVLMSGGNLFRNIDDITRRITAGMMVTPLELSTVADEIVDTLGDTRAADVTKMFQSAKDGVAPDAKHISDVAADLFGARTKKRNWIGRIADKNVEWNKAIESRFRLIVYEVEWNTRWAVLEPKVKKFMLSGIDSIRVSEATSVIWDMAGADAGRMQDIVRSLMTGAGDNIDAHVWNAFMGPKTIAAMADWDPAVRQMFTSQVMQGIQDRVRILGGVGVDLDKVMQEVVEEVRITFRVQKDEAMKKVESLQYMPDERTAKVGQTGAIEDPEDALKALLEESHERNRLLVATERYAPQHEAADNALSSLSTGDEARAQNRPVLGDILDEMNRVDKTVIDGLNNIQKNPKGISEPVKQMNDVRTSFNNAANSFRARTWDVVHKMYNPYKGGILPKGNRAAFNDVFSRVQEESYKFSTKWYQRVLDNIATPAAAEAKNLDELQTLIGRPTVADYMDAIGIRIERNLSGQLYPVIPMPAGVKPVAMDGQLGYQMLERFGITDELSLSRYFDEGLLKSAEDAQAGADFSNLIRNSQGIKLDPVQDLSIPASRYDRTTFLGQKDIPGGHSTRTWDNIPPPYKVGYDESAGYNVMNEAMIEARGGTQALFSPVDTGKPSGPLGSPKTGVEAVDEAITGSTKGTWILTESPYEVSAVRSTNFRQMFGIDGVVRGVEVPAVGDLGRSFRELRSMITNKGAWRKVDAAGRLEFLARMGVDERFIAANMDNPAKVQQALLNKLLNRKPDAAVGDSWEIFKEMDDVRKGAFRHSEGSSRVLNEWENELLDEAWTAYTQANDWVKTFGVYSESPDELFDFLHNEWLNELASGNDSAAAYAASRLHLIEAEFHGIKSQLFTDAFGYSPGAVRKNSFSRGAQTFLAAGDDITGQFIKMESVMDALEAEFTGGARKLFDLSEDELLEMADAIFGTEGRIGAAQMNAEMVEAIMYGSVRDSNLESKTMAWLPTFKGSDVGEGAVSSVGTKMINYDDTRIFDDAMRIAMPFWKFSSRNVMSWLETMARNPQMLGWYSNYMSTSQTMVRQAGLIDSKGSPLKSYRGKVPLGHTGLWFNPLAPLSFRFAFQPMLNQKSDFEQSVDDNPFMAFANNAIQMGRNWGFSPGPMTEYLLNKSGVDEHIKYAAVPILDMLTPPWLTRMLEQNMGAFGYKAAGMIKAGKDWNAPDVPWNDYLVESEMLGSFLVDYPDMTEDEAVTRMDEIRKVLSINEDSTDSRSDYDVWNNASYTVGQDQWAAGTQAYFTGFYVKRETEGSRLLLELRQKMNVQRLSVNSLLGREIFGLDADAETRLAMSNKLRFDTHEGTIYNMYNDIRWVADEGGSQLYGMDRWNAIAENMAYDQTMQSYYEGMERSGNKLEADLRRYPVGTAWADMEGAYDEYYGDLATLNAKNSYLHQYQRFSLYNKPAEVVVEHYTNEWYVELMRSKPKFEVYGDWGTYNAAVSQWEENLPLIASIQLESWSVRPDVIEWVNLPVGISYETLEAFARNSDIDSVAEWNRETDSFLQALNNGWKDMYWGEYWDSVNGLSGSQRELIEMRFFQQFDGGAPSAEQLFEYLEENYVGRDFTLEMVEKQMKNVIKDPEYQKPVLSIDDRMFKTDNDRIESEIYDILYRFGGGEGAALLENELNERDIASQNSTDLWYAENGGGIDNLSDEQAIIFHRALKDIEAELNFLPLTEAQVLERVELERLNTMFKEFKEIEFGTDFSNQQAIFWGDMDAGERKDAYNKETRDALYRYSEFRDSYGAMFPLWGSYYTSDVVTGYAGTPTFLSYTLAQMSSRSAAEINIFFVDGDKVSRETTDELQQIWEDEGKPNGSYNGWLQNTLRLQFDMTSTFGGVPSDGLPRSLPSYVRYEVALAATKNHDISSAAMTKLKAIWKNTLGADPDFDKWLAQLEEDYDPNWKENPIYTRPNTSPGKTRRGKRGGK